MVYGSPSQVLRQINGLVALHPNPNVRDTFGQRPLHFAAFRNHVQVIDLLIDLGADVNLKDHENHLPAQYALRNRRDAAAARLISHMRHNRC